MSAAELKATADHAYRSGQIRKAAQLYKEAVEMDPESPTLLSNLSAALFELGDLENSLLRSQETLTKIASSTGTDDLRPLKAKNQMRICRVLVASKRYDAALDEIKAILDATDSPADIRTTALSLLGTLNHVVGLGSSTEEEARIRISSAPMFRPSMKPVFEYYTVRTPHLLWSLSFWGELKTR